MLLYLIILIGVMALVLYVSSPEFKVKLGEIAITGQANNHLGEEYTLLNNCNLASDDGAVQIDHILLSPYGIFVIETKNHQGEIFGSPEQKKWTRKIYKTSFKFKNPLQKNQNHVAVVQKLLADLTVPQNLKSVVVFTSQSSFKTDMPVNVVKGLAWIDYIKQFDQAIISPQMLERIQYRIEQNLLKKEVTPAHIPVENLEDKRAA